MSVPPAAVRPTRAQPVRGDRLAWLLRRSRWPLVIGWVLAIVLLHPFAGRLYQVTNDTAAANLPASAPSTRVAALQEATEHGADETSSDGAAVIFARGSGLTTADLATVDSAQAAVERLDGRLRGLGAPGPLERSPDGQAEVFTVQITAPRLERTGVDTDAVKAIRQTVDQTTSGTRNGLQVAVTGEAAVTADSGEETQNALLVTAVVIVALILLVVYRSVLLWVFPLFSGLAGIVIAQTAAHGLGRAGLTVSSLSTSILIVLAFGTASDYALLLTHRYREELRHHAATEDAMAAALRRTVPTLVASAATVVGAMLCLLAAESASLHGLGPVGAIAVASALLAQTTFLPALLLVVGRAAFWPRRPRVGETGREESRLWSGIGTRVARHRIWVALGAVVVLGTACAALVTVRTDNNPLDNLKGHPDSVTGAQYFAEHFGSGAIAPLVVLTPLSEVDTVVATARSTPGVAEVVASPPVDGYAGYSVTLSVDPFGAKGSAVIEDLRHRLDRDAAGSLVGGEPAIQYDITRAAHRDALVLIPLVLLVILVVVALLLRAVVAPVVLVATTALSFGASFGLVNLLWRYGFGYHGIQAQLPLYIFVFLVALGVDYSIFLSARIREEARHLGTWHGTLRGLSVTGGVITAAGFVLAGTFAALAQQPLVDLTEVGTAVAIGVLLDTLLVRTVLVPAALLTIGERAWWPAPARPRGQDSAASVPDVR